MKLTSQEEYGVRCLVRVAREAPELVSIRTIAESEGLSVDYVAKLTRLLRKAGLIEAVRGTHGGYRLARSPEQISASEFMAALDSPLYDDGFCDNHTGKVRSCVHTTDCSVRSLWRAVDTAVDSVLQKVTLADLVIRVEQPEAAK